MSEVKRGLFIQTDPETEEKLDKMAPSDKEKELFLRVAVELMFKVSPDSLKSGGFFGSLKGALQNAFVSNKKRNGI